MAQTDPLVSVIIANYNYGRFLKQCIRSVITQTYARVEIIVVDDGSSDDSRDVITRFGGAVRSIFQPNAGQAAAISSGFAISKGDFVALLDADDGWYPHKLKVVAETFRARPRVQWLRHKLAVVNEKLEPQGGITPKYRRSSYVPGDPVMLLERGIEAGSSLVMRRALAEQVFPVHIPPELALAADDTVLLARMLATGALGYSLNEVLGYARQHPGSRSSGEDLAAMLRREAALKAALGELVGHGRPSSSYQLESVLGAVYGRHFWEAQRAGNYLRGVGALTRLWRRPGLLARQAASLTYALAAPHAWARRFRERAAPPP